MDIKEVFQECKESLLKDGQHQPMIFAQFDDGKKEAVIFGNFPDLATAEKVKAFFMIGRQIGVSHKKQKLSQVYFVIEIWLSQGELGKPRKYRRPKDDPARREALMALALTVDKQNNATQTVHLAEMIRDSRGSLIDLLPYDDESLGPPQSNLLTSFLSGFESAKLSDREFADRVSQSAKKARKH